MTYFSEYFVVSRSDFAATVNQWVIYDEYVKYEKSKVRIWSAVGWVEFCIEIQQVACDQVMIVKLQNSDPICLMCISQLKK